MVIIAIFIAKLLSLVAILGALLGFVARHWWHVAVGSIVIGILDEVLMSSIKYTYRFEPLVLILGIAAAGTWAGAVFFFAQRRRNRNSI